MSKDKYTKVNLTKEQYQGTLISLFWASAGTGILLTGMVNIGSEVLHGEKVTRGSIAAIIAGIVFISLGLFSEKSLPDSVFIE